VAEEMGIDLATESQIRIIFAPGEPGAEIPATRKLIEERWGGKCYGAIGATEMPTGFGFGCAAQKGLHLIENMFLPEIVDPESSKLLEPGKQGELVLSNLSTESMPLIRYRMGDIAKINYDRCDCGRTFALMDGGVLGRVDDMIIFAGVNIYPSVLERLIRGFKQFSSEYQIIVPEMGSGKRLKIRVEPRSEALGKKDLEKASAKLVEEIKWKVKVTPEIEIARMGSLPRFELKARRVVREE
jgi:phenylacetate-CoA ligase